MPSHVLILGCGRSGTSIFGELFDAIPGYTYISEPLLTDLPELGPGACLAVKVPRTGAADRPPPGLPVDLDVLFRALPTPLVVFWQVRHPLDAICSLRVGIAEGWAHHPRPPDWQEWLDRPLIERCANHWAVINGAGFEHVRHRARINRFEEMIRDPLACAEATVRAVGMDAEAAGPALGAWAARVQDTNNDQFVEAVTSRRHSRPDHRHRVDRWRENLTDAEVAAVVPIIESTAAKFGYELPS